MKKIIIFLLICVLVILGVFGLNKSKESKTYRYNNISKDSLNEIIKIMEPVYLDYINEIYLAPDKYLGKTIEIEGMFTAKYDENENKTYDYVYRLSDEIHYHDDEEHKEEVMSGLEFVFDGEMPKENDWIKVIGVLEKEENNNIVIKATSVEVLDKRGIEKVTTFY